MSKYRQERSIENIIRMIYCVTVKGQTWQTIISFLALMTNVIVILMSNVIVIFLKKIFFNNVKKEYIYNGPFKKNQLLGHYNANQEVILEHA